jgi:O-antigen ligase
MFLRMSLNKHTFHVIFIAFIFFLLSVQAFSINFYSISIKPFHIFAMILLIVSPVVMRINISKWLPLFAFFFYLFSSSIISLVTTKPFTHSLLILNYFFAFLVCILGGQIGRIFKYESIVLALRMASGLLLLATLIKILFSWQDIYEYLQDPYAHPELFWLYGGGPNLEATWLVMNAAFFRRSKFFWSFWFLSLAISVLYASRAAILLGIVLALLELISERRWRTFVAFFCMILLSGIFVYLVNPHSFERFMQIGQETGSVTRLEMWSGAITAIQQMPITGFGAGNAITAIEWITNKDFLEDNVHNYFLQVLLDFGPLGLLIWLCFVSFVLRRSHILTKKDEIGTYIVLYFVASLVQFRGAEPLFWFVMGIFISSRNKKVGRMGDV